MEKHTLIITTANGPGTLARVSGLLAARGVDIDSVSGVPAADRKTYRIRVEIFGTESRAEQTAKQLRKLVDTIKVTDVTANRRRGSGRFLSSGAQSRTASA